MVGKKNPPPAPDAQPTGSGVVPGSQQGAEMLDQPGVRAGGEQVQPGVNDGTPPEPLDKGQEEELKSTEADKELAEEEADLDKNFVGFHGEFSKREITVDEWRAAGVQDQPGVTWNRANNRRVPKDAFTAQALNVLRQDPDFRVP